MTVLAKNRKASHDYEILERYEAGIELRGTEVKSCRARSISLADAHARIRNGEVWLYGVHIAPYKQGNINNHEPRRTRKLLLKKKQIRSLAQSTQTKGTTLIPLSIFLRKNMIKVELGLCKGKAKHDKREEMRRKIHKKEADDAIKKRV